ncbi:MAG: SDR family oxidoreductase [Chloroflexi bacterium]|nr:SDR family oxidoreductase [Chloroflexota bacterium]
MTVRVALVTGASSGIGYATALAFARAGYHVIATARRVERLAQLEAAVQALPAPHGDMLTLACDVQNADDVQNAVTQALARFGGLHVLVANAGVGQRGALVDAAWGDIETLLRTNIDGVLHSVRAAAPAMRAGGGGHIIIISSVVYNMVTPYTAAYAASKAFVSSIAAALRLELAADHIAVSDVLVGRTTSEFNQRRLGHSGYSERAARLPRMSAEYVAERLVRASSGRGGRFALRFFDRLIVLGNLLLPGLIGRLAMRQYK